MRNTDTAPDAFAPYFVAFYLTKGRACAMMQSAYQLRYEVYCVDCGFLRAEDYPEGQERDEYDEQSAHFFAHNLQKELVGYVRLVTLEGGGLFPWQERCTELYDGIVLPPSAECAEISRLMVRRDYRRRRGDILSGVATRPAGDAGHPDRRSESPQILVSLYRQMYQHSLEAGIRYWYAAMERPLVRVLQFMDFGFRQLGEQTEYFGPVAPYVADLRQLEDNLLRSNPALLAWFQKPCGPEN